MSCMLPHSLLCTLCHNIVHDACRPRTHTRTLGVHVLHVVPHSACAHVVAFLLCPVHARCYVCMYTCMSYAHPGLHICMLHTLHVVHFARARASTHSYMFPNVTLYISGTRVQYVDFGHFVPHATFGKCAISGTRVQYVDFGHFVPHAIPGQTLCHTLGIPTVCKFYTMSFCVTTCRMTYLSCARSMS